jgi:hypothetical protein
MFLIVWRRKLNGLHQAPVLTLVFLRISIRLCSQYRGHEATKAVEQPPYEQSGHILRGMLNKKQKRRRDRRGGVTISKLRFPPTFVISSDAAERLPVAPDAMLYNRVRYPVARRSGPEKPMYDVDLSWLRTIRYGTEIGIVPESPSLYVTNGEIRPEGKLSSSSAASGWT